MRRILAFYTKYFVLWVVLAGVVALYRPGVFLPLGRFNQVFFALTMFGIGAVLQPEDFRRIARRPGLVALGSIAQFTIMPLGAFVAARLFGLPPELAVGLIVAGSAPGAMASNVMCYVARADTAYSVSLTTVSTLLCPVLTPALVKLLAGQLLPVPFWDQFFTIFWTVIVPLWAGFAVRHFGRARIARIQEVFPAISVTFIVFICALVVAGNRDRILQEGQWALLLTVLAAVAALNLYGMAAGYGVGALLGLEPARRRTLCIEIGMQNAGLGTVLALKHFGPRSALPTAMFVFVCILTASLLVEIWRRGAQRRTTGIQSGG